MRVSSHCACAIGATTRSTGSAAKNTVPSGIAHTSPLKRIARSHCAKPGANRPERSTQARSSSLKRASSTKSSACSSPAATRNARPGGSLRTNNSNTAVPAIRCCQYACSIVNW